MAVTTSGRMGTPRTANIAAIYATESVAGTVAYDQINTGVNAQDKVAWILHRAEYNPLSVNSTQFNTSTDYMYYGLTTSASYDPPAVPVFSDPALVDLNRLSRQDIGTAASGFFRDDPWIKDWSSLPGGGILIPAISLYAFVKGSGLAGVASFSGRVFFTPIEIKSVDEYWALVQAYRIYQ